jgi:hypothetical protein
VTTVTALLQRIRQGFAANAGNDDRPRAKPKAR